MRKIKKSMRVSSRDPYKGTVTINDDGSRTAPRADVDTGSLQRIADACELMAKDRKSLEDELANVKSNRDYLSQKCTSLGRSNAALRGQITKLKKKLAEVCDD